MTHKSLLVLAVLVAAGCATVPERNVALENARVAVYAARNNPQVASYAPLELDQAVATLFDADDLAARGGRIDEVHRLADLARQRAVAAQETARLRTAEAAQRAAREARVQAELSRQQAQAAQAQAAAAQLTADEAQRRAAAAQASVAPGVVAPPGVIAQPSLAAIGAQPTARGLVVTLTDPMFEPGHATLTPGAMYNVQEIAAYLRAHPDRGVTIEGFSDRSGNSYLDGQLSYQRAMAAQSALVSLGVDPRQITVHSYGDARPLASNSTAAGRLMNRRVEIVIP